MFQKDVVLRLIGFIASLILTLAIYFLIVDYHYLNITPRFAVTLILILATIQTAIQIIFFLDIWDEKGTYWNLVTFVSTLSIMAIIIIFSIWIMNTLDYNMMPMMK